MVFAALGIIEMHDGDIYGTTVNLAARIDDWAKAGEIGMSQSFHEQLGPTVGDFQDAGPRPSRTSRCLWLASSFPPEEELVLCEENVSEIHLDRMVFARTDGHYLGHRAHGLT